MKTSLNVGCGERTYEQYPDGYLCTNLDERSELPNVDIMCDVRDMSAFKKGQFNYILASDILEHFPISQTSDVLKVWMTVLSDGGTIELRVPNFNAIIKHYKEHNNMQHISWMLMGGQNYAGNFHYIVFNEKWLREICESVGLKFCSCVDEGPNIVMKLKKVEVC